MHRPSRKEFGELAVSERLLVSGLLEQFDTAASVGDRTRMIRMLRRIDLPEHYACRWVDALLEDRKIYRRWAEARPNQSS